MTRQPRRGEWILIDDGSGTVAQCQKISRTSVFPTAWFKTMGGREFPYSLRGGRPYHDLTNLSAIGITHRFTFTRNIYFRGFPIYEATRNVILLASHLNGEVNVVVDSKTMRKDAVLMSDVSEVVRLSTLEEGA